MAAEPAQLLVALSAAALKRALNSGGVQEKADGCTWEPAQGVEFKVAFSAKPSPADADFTDVAIVKAPVDPSSPVAAIAFAAVPFSSPLMMRIKATPTERAPIFSAKGEPQGAGMREIQTTINEVPHWPGTAYFIYEGAGVWKRFSRSPDEDEANCAIHFSPPATLYEAVPQPSCLTFITFFLSRLRDCTRQCLRTVQDSGANPAVWMQDSVNLKHISAPAVSGGHLRFVTAKITLDHECRVFELKEFKAARLISVCWPRVNKEPSPNEDDQKQVLAAPMESLLFFHASYGQNAQIYGKSSHPFGYAWVSHGLHKYVNPGDVQTEVYPLSLTHQIAAAGKRTVLVLPLNRLTFPELAELNHTEQLVDVLSDIHATFLRLAGLFWMRPRLGRMAVASFSAGVQEMLRCMQGLARHPLTKTLVREAYVFEPVHDNGTKCANYANSLKGWAGKNADWRVRLYNNESSAEHQALVDARSMPSPPYVVDSADLRFTAGVIPDPEWRHSLTDVERVQPMAHPDFIDVPTTKPAPAQSTRIEVTKTKGFTVGDVFVIRNLRGHTITGLGPQEITFTPPFDVDVDASIGVRGARLLRHKTTLATPAKAGRQEIAIADAGLLGTNDFLLIGNRDGNQIAEISGTTVRLVFPLVHDWPAGATVQEYDMARRTKTTAAVKAGATTLPVRNGISGGIQKGHMVRIAGKELGKVVAVQEDAVTLASPLGGDMPAGAVVESVEMTKFAWGLFHAMPVGAFLTDAMRKSGFK